METNIDDFILSLESIAKNVDTDGTVRRSSLRLAPLKKNRCFS